MFRPILAGLGLFATLGTASLFGDGQGAVVTAAAAAPSPQVTDTRPTERMTDALAAAVVESIARQFETGDVLVQLGPMQVLQASERDRELRGSGRVRIDSSTRWIAFDFAALYDTETAEVAAPRLQLERGATTARADDALARKLEARVAKALAEEFAGQAVSWTARSTTALHPGERLVRLSGTGVADFGADGRVAAHVDALYDRVTGRWVRVSYELGEPAGMDVQAGVASL